MTSAAENASNSQTGVYAAECVMMSGPLFVDAPAFGCDGRCRIAAIVEAEDLAPLIEARDLAPLIVVRREIGLFTRQRGEGWRTWPEDASMNLRRQLYACNAMVEVSGSQWLWQSARLGQFQDSQQPFNIWARFVSVLFWILGLLWLGFVIASAFAFAPGRCWDTRNIRPPAVAPELARQHLAQPGFGNGGTHNLV